jgi:energy-converting hydrogenase Eha subunit A
MQVPKNLGCLVKMLFGFCVLLVMGYCALIALSPKARKWATSKEGPTPFAAVNQILAIPAQAIGKTKDVVAASDARVGVLNGVISEEDAKAKKGAAAAGQPVVDPFATPAAAPGPGAAAPAATPAEDQSISRAALLAMQEQAATANGDETAAPTPPVPPPALVREEPKPTEAPAPAEVKLSGGITIANASLAHGPPAGPRFFFWVVGLNVSGVFQSSPHRILLNNRLVYEGDKVNDLLGIVFDRIDVDRKLIMFRDPSGALVTRSY